MIWALRAPRLKKLYVLVAQYPHTNGARGCAMTHIAVAGGEEPAGARALAQGAARDLSGSSAHPRAQPPVHAADPRIAIDGYWRAHPLRADRLARALAAESGAPSGWTWRLSTDRRDGLPATFRSPPAPYREAAFSRGPGYCCVCGQPVYRFGWHRDLWQRGPNRNAGWHTACVVAWRLWNAPSDSRGCSSGCSRAAAPRPARGCGRPRRSTTACAVPGLGRAPGRGLAGLAFWGCPTCRSSTGTSTLPSAPTRRLCTSRTAARDTKS